MNGLSTFRNSAKTAVVAICLIVVLVVFLAAYLKAKGETLHPSNHGIRLRLSSGHQWT
jgi:uncharacterized membrane protein affecting hemolysin expression